MNHFDRIYRNLVCVILILGVSVSSQKNNYKLHLVFTNDIRGEIQHKMAPFINPEFPPPIGGGATALEYVRELRRSTDENGQGVLVLDGGNLFQGTPLGTYDGGATIVKWMNAMEYDASVVGNYDFDQGVANVRKLAVAANFPLLGANIIDNKTGKQVDFLKSYIFKKMDDVTVAILGITTSSLPSIALPSKIEGLRFEREIPIVRQLVKEVRSKGADVVVLLAHLGLPYDIEDQFAGFLEEIAEGRNDWEMSPVNTMELAHFIEGVDVIISGHITKGYNRAWEDPLTHTLCFQTYGGGTSIGHVILEIDPASKRLVGYKNPSDSGVLLTLFDDDYQTDFTMADSISYWLEKVKSTMIHEEQSVFEVESKGIKLQDKWDIPHLGTVDQLEVVTWNIEFFPKAGDTTVTAIAEVISDLDADIIGFQEIGERGAFADLLNLLPEYDYVVSQSSSFFDQAVIVRKSAAKILSSEELFTYNDYWFAGRPPFRVNLSLTGGDSQFPLSVINIHMKCCDDGIPRRQVASRMLADYLIDQYDKGDSNIVVLGDWNDEITDPWHEQSLNPFVQDKDNFYFTTTPIASDTSMASYPSWPSFLDHILITRGLFDEHRQTGTIQTLQLPDFVGGWETYEHIISDHLPVMWTIRFQHEQTP